MPHTPAPSAPEKHIAESTVRRLSLYLRVLEQAAARGANDVAERYQSAIPLGRYATPAEVTAMVLFLCSDEASAITGGQFQVDGGRTACPGGSAWR